MADTLIAVIVIGLIGAFGIFGIALLWQLGFQRHGMNFFEKLKAQKVTVILEDLGELKVRTISLASGEIDLFGNKYRVNENWIRNGVVFGEYYNKNFVQKRFVTCEKGDIERLLPKDAADHTDSLSSTQQKYVVWLKDLQMQKELAETNLDFLVSQYTEIREMVGQDAMEVGKTIAMTLMMVLVIIIGISQTYAYAGEHIVPPSATVQCNWQYQMTSVNTSNGTIRVVQPTGVIEQLTAGLTGR